MTSVFGRLAPGATAKLNIAFDLMALVLVLVTTTVASDRDVWGSVELFWWSVLAVLLWIFTASAAQLYDPFSNRGILDELALLSLIVLLQGLALGAAKVLFGGWMVDVPRVGHFVLPMWGTVVGGRVLLLRRLAARNEEPLDDVLVVGIGPRGVSTAEDLGRCRPRRTVRGFLRWPSEFPSDELMGKPVLGGVTDLEETLRNHPVAEVYLAGSPSRDGAAMQQVVRSCEELGIPFALPAFPFRFERARPVRPTAVVDGYLHFVPFESRPVQRAVKRLFDIAVSATALLVLSPLLIAVAAAIKFTSKGPVLFKQQRVGLHGRPFQMLKFRSMVVNAEELKAKLAAQNEQTGPVFKMKNDPRVTPIGRFIRKYSIDELPQLFNILRGDMSVVGPRPPVPPEVIQYQPWQLRRLSVRPGLTCIWQVSGRNQISFEEWMYMDMRYIDHWSFRSDLELIVRTFPVVLTGRGAS